QPKVLATSFVAGPGVAGWSSDNKRIYFSEPKGTGTQIYAVDVAANRIEEIKTTPAVIGALSLNNSGNTFAFVRQTSDTPGDVFVAAALPDFNPVQITTINADIKTPPVGRTE